MILSASLASAVTLFRASELTGEPVVFPTDTIYGIGAPITSVRANEKVYEIKRRPAGKPLPILVADYAQLGKLVHGVPESVSEWLERVWPGGYTVIFHAADELHGMYKAGNTVAVRMLPPGWLASAVSVVGPITATSVNASGRPPLLTASEIEREFGTLCRYMLWGESGSEHSKITDVTGGSPKTIRG